MPGRPSLLSAKFDGSNVLTLTYSRSLNYSGLTNLSAFKACNANGEFKEGLSVGDATDEVLQLNMDDAADSGLTPLPGSASNIADVGLVAADGGEPIFPFAVRRTNPYIVSATWDAGTSKVTIVWNEAAYGGDVTKFKFTLEAGTHKHGVAIDSGGDTATWVITTVTGANGVPNGRWTAEAGTCESADSAPSAPGAGVLLTP